MVGLSGVDHSIEILIVDDLPVVRRIVKSALLELGFPCFTEAENGLAALEKLRAGEFQLVIADWHMPNMTGIDLLKAIRSDDRLKKISFLMCTSRIEQRHIEEAADAGVSDYLVKPFSTSMLAEKLEAIFIDHKKS